MDRKPEIRNQMDGNLEVSEDTRDSEVANHKARQNILETDVTMQLLAENLKADEGSTENLQAGNVKKRKRQKKKKKEEEEKPETRSWMEGNVEASEDKRDFEIANHKLRQNPLETDVTMQLLAENLKMDEGTTENLQVGNVKKRKRKKKKKKKEEEEMARVKAEMESVGRIKSDAESTENILEVNVTGDRAKDDVQSVDQIKMDIGPTENIAEGNGISKRKRKRKRIKKAKIADEVQCMNQTKMDAYPIENVAVESVIGEGKSNPERIKMAKSKDVKDGKCLYLKAKQMPSIRRKLIVLDVNGLLADVVKPAPPRHRGDIHIYGRAIFKRPFCDDFLKFCFQNFDVGIWSSRSKLILDAVVNHLLGDLKDKLLFCWNMSHSTQTGFKALENRHKPLVCKELRKIWENDNPNFPWKKGDYNESNTLLLDDSPYKALLNPLHTAIFPHPFSYTDKNDKSLGPGGNLRVYLEGLLECESVQKYVEQHPFGQRAINEESACWGFYAEVLERFSNQLAARSAANKRRNIHDKLREARCKELKARPSLLSSTN